MKFKNIISWSLRLTAAIILLQTLYFKFTASPESTELFTKLVGEDFEAYVRIGSGVFELITIILLLIPGTIFLGALLGIGIMGGAILSHLTILGIESQGDGGQLFIYAVIVFICCTMSLWLHKEQGITLYRKLFRK